MEFRFDNLNTDWEWKRLGERFMRARFGTVLHFNDPARQDSHPMIPDPFPASDFDAWAAQYDQDVTDDGFPFTGYARVLDEVVRQAQAAPGMRVLDLGTGTGNLAALFAALGCELWCTDYSPKMLELARAKLPAARFFEHDLRQPFPPELAQRFDCIVSAYVFHHLDLPGKVALAARLIAEHLVPGGRLVIADLSFPTPQARDAICQAAGDRGDEEPYWITAEALPALRAAGIPAAYTQVSDCAGIYRFAK